MQLASHGPRTLVRNASSAISRTSGAARGLHSPAYMRIKPPLASQGVARRLVAGARGAVGRFFAQLTAPGIGVTPSVARSIYGGPTTSFPTISQRMSYPMRVKLSTQTRFFPRAPSIGPPCTVTNLGLGTARNFSSGRTVFQNLVENVPIAGRAFYEADWDLKMRNNRDMMKKSFTSGQNTSFVPKLDVKLKEKSVFAENSAKTIQETDLETYFPSPVSEVSTSLLIPLAPTPTARTPLPMEPDDHRSFLPLRDLGYIHSSHELHSLRVSSLFARLDASNVWEKGVRCSAYAHGAGPDGVCTILKVEFVGWTKEEVRAVIGESGTGWCALEEERLFHEADSDTLSESSSVFSDISASDSDRDMHDLQLLPHNEETTQSFILPTLDFSSSFLNSTSYPRGAPSSGIESPSESQSDTWSEISSADSWVEQPPNQWYGFSSVFLQRSYSETQMRS